MSAQMYADVVMGVEHSAFEHALQACKTKVIAIQPYLTRINHRFGSDAMTPFVLHQQNGAKFDKDLTPAQLKGLVGEYKAAQPAPRPHL
jgi:hypothetical protein